MYVCVCGEGGRGGGGRKEREGVCVVVGWAGVVGWSGGSVRCVVVWWSGGVWWWNAVLCVEVFSVRYGEV